MPTINTLTAAAVVALNGATLSQTFTAQEKYLPRIRKQDIGDGWHVWIVPADVPQERQNRRRIRPRSLFDVGLVKKVDNLEIATVAPCLQLADELQTYFGEQLRDLDGHDLSSTEFDPLYSPSHLKQHSVFLSVLRVNYQRRTQ